MLACILLSGYQALMNKDGVRTTRLNEYLGSLPAALSSLANIIVLVLGIWLIVKGEFTPGMLLAFTGFLSSFMSPVNQLMGLGQSIQEMETQMERIEDVMNYEVDVPETFDDPKNIGDLKQAAASRRRAPTTSSSSAVASSPT